MESLIICCEFQQPTYLKRNISHGLQLGYFRGKFVYPMDHHQCHSIDKSTDSDPKSKCFYCRRINGLGIMYEISDGKVSIKLCETCHTSFVENV